MNNPTLPLGVAIKQLTTNVDDRGNFTELFRAQWQNDFRFKQWNIVQSKPNMIRGFHVHIGHADYLICVSGKMTLALKDLRENSPTFNLTSLLELSEEKLAGVFIPPGVGHGFCYTQAATHMYAVSEYWGHEKELGCAWNDNDLRIDWPLTNPHLSEKDAKAMPLKNLMQELKGQDWKLCSQAKSKRRLLNTSQNACTI